MNIENVKALTKILCENGLTAIEAGEGENFIRIEKAAVPCSAPAVVPQSYPAIQQDKTIADASAFEIVQTATDDKSVNFNHLVEVKSPLVGVYYSAPSPDSENFVSIGSKVKKGDVICIIETMKLMNEILAEQDGEIVDICIKNGDIAEFGQVLFKMY